VFSGMFWNADLENVEGTHTCFYSSKQLVMYANLNVERVVKAIKIFEIALHLASYLLVVSSVGWVFDHVWVFDWVYRYGRTGYQKW